MVRKAPMIRNAFWVSASGVILADQVSKAVIISLQPTLSWLHVVKNTGAGFGILQGYTLWLGILSLAIALAVVFNYHKLPSERIPQLLWGLFLGGVLGNFIDRALRGFVIDFIDLRFWPAFNVADSALTISVIGLIWWYWKKQE